MKLVFNGFCLYKKQICKIFDSALKKIEPFAENVVVEVSFVLPTQILSLNRDKRGVDRVTDVLSFPMLEKSKQQPLSDFDDEREIDGSLFLGDIVVCKKRAKAQAKEFGHSYKREVCFLVLHGLLHLLGYDHQTQSEEVEMMSLAEDILSEENVLR